MAARTPILACITLGLTLGAAFFQPPQITFQDPRILYTLALYKSAMGDTAAALRLMQRAEQSKKRAQPAPQQIRTRLSQPGCSGHPARG